MKFACFAFVSSVISLIFKRNLLCCTVALVSTEKITTVKSFIAKQRETVRQINRLTNSQTDEYGDKWSDCQKDGQADGQTDRRTADCFFCGYAELFIYLIIYLFLLPVSTQYVE